jgi:hypothetical protein
MSGSQWDAASQNVLTNLGQHIGGAPYFNIDTVTATSGFCTQYCGWHDHTAVSGSDIKYAFVGNAETHDGQEHADKCAWNWTPFPIAAAQQPAKRNFVANKPHAARARCKKLTQFHAGMPVFPQEKSHQFSYEELLQNGSAGACFLSSKHSSREF